MDTQELTNRQLRSRLAEAEKSLATSERMNRTILDASSDMVIRLDREGTYLEYRGREEMEISVKPEVFLGKRVDEILPAANAERVMSFIETALATGQVQEYEFQLPVPLESDNFHEFEARLVAFGNDEVLIVCRDITEQKRSNEALKASEERLKLALDAGRMGLWEWNSQTGEMNWSDGSYRLLGLEPGEVKSSYKASISSMHPDDLPEVRKAVEIALRDHTEFHHELRYIWPDNSVHWVVARGRFVYDASGEATRMIGVAADIDERKQSEEALRIRELQYREIFDASADGLLIAKPDGTFEDGNPAFCQMHGIEHSELVGLRPEQFIHPDSLHILEKFFAAVGSGNSYHSESIGLRKNGEAFDCEVSGVPFIQDGRKNILATIRDISERKQAERRLQESEQKYRSLFDNSVAGVAITDFSGQLLEANEAICELLGYSPEELKQINAGKFYAEPKRRKEYLETLLRFGKAKDFQLELIRKNGEPLWGSFSSATIKWQGKDAIATTVIDLTKRKQAEANYQKLVEEMNGIVFQCEIDTLCMTYVSPHAEELLGYAVSEWFADPNFWASHIHPDDREFAVTYCAQQVLAGRDHAIQYRMIAADGHEVWIHDTIRLVRDQSNKVTHIHGVMLDISEQKQIEHDLKETEERFRLAAQSVSDLIWMRDLSSDHLIWYGDVDGALGYDQGEFPRTLDAYRKLIHPEDYERVSMASEEVARLQGNCSTEYRILGKDGEYRHWVDSWEPVCDDKGVPIRFIGAVQDITDRKLAEREREARYRHSHIMNRINQIIVKATDLNEMLDKLIGELLESVGADRVWLMSPCDPRAKDAVIVVERTTPEYPGTHVLGLRLPISKSFSTLLQTYLESEGPLATGPDEISKVVSPDVIQRFHIKSQLGVALRPKGGTPWLLGLHQCSYGRIWNEDEIHLLDSVARRIEDALTQMLMQEELQEWELQLAGAQKVAKLGSFQSTFGNDYASCSEELCNILELGPNNRTPSHRLLFDRLHPEDRRRFTREFSNAIAGRPLEEEAEYRVVLPSGAVKTLLSRAEVVRNDRGKPTHLLGTLQDITERKLAEEFLKNSEQKYRTLVETSPYCIHQIDVKNRIMSMNRAGLKMLGVGDESSVIGLPYLQAICDEDQERVSRLLEDAFAGSSWEFEFRSANGRDMRTTIVPKYDSHGKVDRLLGIAQDITEQKRAQQKLAASEARYRSLMEDANDAIILIDTETGMLVDANQEAQEMLKRSQKEILYMHFAELYPAEALDGEQDISLLQLVEGGGVLDELSVVDRDGRRIPVEVSSSVIQIEDSRVVQCIFRNLTERKRIEKELQQKEAEIAKVSRLSTLGELTSGIAHELNQPLTAIANYVEAIKDLVQLEGRENEDLLQILSNLGSTTFRTSTIISRLRGLIQKAALHRTAMNVNELAEELIEFLSPQLERSHIQVQLELAENLPTLVIDPIQIQQVLLNLIKNAQEAMEQTAKDRRYLTLHTQRVDETVELSITDSGKGLPPEDIERLFDYFYTTTPGGLGVGLQVCRTIMEAHHGNIVALNNSTEGATFRLVFPLCTKEASYVR